MYHVYRKGIKHFILIVNMHCNPDNGDLHCMAQVGIEARVVSFNIKQIIIFSLLTVFK